MIFDSFLVTIVVIWFVSVLPAVTLYARTKSFAASVLVLFGFSGAIAALVAQNSVMAVVLTMSPIWTTATVYLIFIGIFFVLAKYGYLGDYYKWGTELNFNRDREFMASKKIIDREEAKKMAKEAETREEFRNEVVEAAMTNAEIVAQDSDDGKRGFE